MFFPFHLLGKASPRKHGNRLPLQEFTENLSERSQEAQDACNKAQMVPYI